MPINLHDIIQDLKADGIILLVESKKYHPTTVVTLEDMETGVICSSPFDSRKVSDNLTVEIAQVKDHLKKTVKKYKEVTNG